MPPPGPVKIGHKKDGRRRQPHRFHVSRPPLPGRWIRYCYMQMISVKHFLFRLFRQIQEVSEASTLSTAKKSVRIEFSSDQQFYM